MSSLVSPVKSFFTKHYLLLVPKIKGWWFRALPTLDMIAWFIFPPYGIYIGVRHVRENWEYYRDMAESFALMLADRNGYSDEEQEEMLVRMKESRYKNKDKENKKK